MQDKEVVLTKDGLRKLEQELENLKTVKRREVAARIKQAIEFGDISENSEFEDAKNEQAFIEGRIITLDKLLSNVSIIEDSEERQGEVTLGSTVLLWDLEMSEALEYTIVGATEANPLENRISYVSPVGAAIIGHVVGDICEVRVPAGLVRFRLDEIR